MSSPTNNNTKASILRHLRSRNIRAGYLLNNDQFPFGPFLQLTALRTTDDRVTLFLTVQPRRSAREAIRTWRENYGCDKV